MTLTPFSRRVLILLLPFFAGLWVSARWQGGGAGPGPGRPSYPPARVVDASEDHHGIAVKDPYRWLEDTRSEETTRWLKAEDELLKSYVRAVPEREAMRRRILELGEQAHYAAPVKGNGRYFLMKIISTGISTELWVQESLNAPPRLLLDTKARFSGRDVTLSGFSPSPDGRYVAYTLSEGQSRWLDLRILETASAVDRPAASLKTHSLSAVITWDREGRRFFYTHYDKAEGANGDKAPAIHPTIRSYDLDQALDALAFEPPAEPGVLVGHALSDDGRYLVLSLRDGSSSKNRVLYKDLGRAGEEVRTLMPTADANYTFLGSEGTLFWFFTDLEARGGRVIAVDIAKPERRNWKEVIPEAPEPIAANSAVGGNALGMFGNRFVLMYLRDGRGVLRVFDKRGRLEYEPDLPPGGLIWGGLSGSQRDSEVFYRFLGLTEPGTVYRLDVETKQNLVFHRPPTSFQEGEIVVEQLFYQSKDGTRIPMFVAHRKDLKREGRNPAYMYGYGAFGWVSFLWYQPFVLNWLELGGVYAQPSLRGGGEYGEAWHQAGAKQNKQTVIDDYIAAAEWLVTKGYTSPDRLVANGGSASAGLAAAAILRRPDLFGATVIDRPILDMVRFDQFSQASYWLPEFGSPRDADEFRALYAWSPYHNLKKGRCYPPTLVMVGERDQVAVPLHAYKFTAAMQAAQGCANPVLLKVMWGAGHNFGTTSEQVADSWGDEAAFLVRALGMGRSGTVTPPD